MAQPVVPLERGLAGRADASRRCWSASSGCRRCMATSRRKGLWDEHLPRRRRAGGLVRRRRRRPRPCRRRPTSCSSAAWRAPAAATSVGRGATLALNCTMCHGAQGMSASDAPNLAGQYPEVVIKQLQDYKAGKRASPIMEALAQEPVGRATSTTSPPTTPTCPRRARRRPPTTRRCRRWCASARRCATSRPASPATAASTRSWARRGSRACPRTTWSPQLRAFRDGARRNDSEAQMRNVARAMTDAEIEEVVDLLRPQGQPGRRAPEGAAPSPGSPAGSW